MHWNSWSGFEAGTNARPIDAVSHVPLQMLSRCRFVCWSSRCFLKVRMLIAQFLYEMRHWLFWLRFALREVFCAFEPLGYFPIFHQPHILSGRELHDQLMVAFLCLCAYFVYALYVTCRVRRHMDGSQRNCLPSDGRSDVAKHNRSRSMRGAVSSQPELRSLPVDGAAW